MDLDLERIAFGSVVGVTGVAVAAGAGRERNQRVDLGEEFDEIAGSNGACLYEVLMRVTRIASAHESFITSVNVKLSFLEWQIPFGRRVRVRFDDSSGGIRPIQ